MIVAGLAPAILGNLADNVGRRIAYLVIISTYCTANIGLALQSNWTALFILRMLQSAGSAATIALGYGVVSDVASPAERGVYISGMVLGPNIATAIGPVIGGALTGNPGWRWIFWLLSILSGACLFLLALLLPETARSMVGNGSGKFLGVRRTILSYLRTRSLSPSPDQFEHSTSNQRDPIEGTTEKRFRLPNPLESLKLLWARDSALITLIFGISYMNLSSLQASTSTLFIGIYGISELQTGLVYLPSGIGSCIGAYATGIVLNHDYRVTARKHGITINDTSGDDLTDFPIEKARFRSIWYVISATAACMVGYGWALHSRVTIVAPLILQFIVGLSTAVIFNMCGTLLVDIHPRSPSTAQAANSIVRAFLAGGVCIGCLGLAWLEWRYGKIWRDKLRERGVER